MARKASAKQTRPSKSYAQFETVAKRSLDLIAIQKPAEKLMALAPNTTPVDLSDMTRAAVVLAVAALDAYFTNVFAERFVPYLKQKGPTTAMVRLLHEAGLDTECALQLLSMQRPYRRIRKLIEGHHAQVTTQRCAVIDELFLAYGLKDFSRHVERMKKRKNLLASVEKLVKRRHFIAHRGDLNRHSKLMSIDPGAVKKRIQDVVQFVSGSDELLQKQLPV